MSFSREKIETLLERIVKSENFTKLYVGAPYSGVRGAGYMLEHPRLTYVLNGCFQLNVGSDKRIERRELSPGETLVMKPYCLTDGVWEKPHETCALVLRKNYLRIVHAVHSSPGIPLVMPTDYYHLKDSLRVCTLRLFEVICSLKGGAETCAVGGKLLQAFFTLLLGDVRNSVASDNGKAYALWSRMTERISDSFAENLTRAGIAAEFAVTETYVSRLFSRYSGLSFLEYLRNVRLDHAGKLLDETNLSVSEIAWNCGFQSASYFIRCFRAAEEISPGERRRLRK